MSGTNSFTGNLGVASSTVAFSNPASLGGPNVNLVFDGGSLNYTGTAHGTLQTPMQFDNGRPATINGGTAGLTVAGALSGFATLQVAGRVTLTGNSPDFSGSLAVGGIAAESVLTINGTIGRDGDYQPFVSAVAGGTLRGSGDIRRPVLIGGELAPGDGIGILHTRNLTLSSNSRLALELGSVSAFDQVNVTGTVTLEGPVLLGLSLAFDPRDGVDSFVIISNDGTDAVAGTGRFIVPGDSLDEGDRFVTGGQEWLISYHGGSDNNDVVLYAVPEPSAAALLAFSTAALAGFRRRRHNGTLIGSLLPKRTYVGK